MSNRDLFWIEELARHWRLTLWQHRCLVKIGGLDDGSLAVEARKLRERWLANPDGDAEWMPGFRDSLYQTLKGMHKRRDDEFDQNLERIKRSVPTFQDHVSVNHVTNATSGWESKRLLEILIHCMSSQSGQAATDTPPKLEPASYAIPADVAARNWIRQAVRLGEWREFTRRMQNAEELQRVARDLGGLTDALDVYLASIMGSQQRSVLGEFLAPGKRELQVIIGECCDLIRKCAKVFRELLNRMPPWAKDLRFEDSLGLFRHAEEELEGATWPPNAILEFVEMLRQSGANLAINEFLPSCLREEQPEQKLSEIGPLAATLDGEALSQLDLLRRLVDGVSTRLDGAQLLQAGKTLRWLWKHRLIFGRTELPDVGVHFDPLSLDKSDDRREVAYDSPPRLLTARMWLENGSTQREILRPACVEVPRKVAPIVVPLRRCAELCQPTDPRLSDLCRDLAQELMVGSTLREWLESAGERADSRRERLWQLATRLELSLTAAHEQIRLGQPHRAELERAGREFTSTTSKGTTGDVLARFTCLEQVSDELAKEGVEWVNASDGTIQDAGELPELRVAPDGLAASPGTRRMVRMPGAVLRLPDGHERRSVVWCRLAQSDDSDSSGSLLARWRDEEFLTRLRHADSTWSGWSAVDLQLSSLTLGSTTSAEMGVSEHVFELFYRQHLEARDDLKGLYRTAAAFLLRHLVELRGGRPICPPLDGATLAPLPPSDADAAFVDTTWVVEASPPGTPLRVEAFWFGGRRGRLVRSLGPRPHADVRAWFELPPFPRSWASESVQGAVTALQRAFETAAASQHTSALATALPEWKKWLATPDGEEWLNQAIDATRRAWRSELQPESQRSATSPTLSDEAKWIDFFKRSSSWPCYPDYDPLQDVVAWPKNQSTTGAAVVWDFDDNVPKGSNLGSQPVRFATRPDTAQGTFSLGRKGTNKALDASWMLLQWSRLNRHEIPRTCDFIAKVGHAMRDREFLGTAGTESSDEVIRENLKHALALLSQEAAAEDQTPRDEALRHLREAAQAVHLEILPAEWSFVSPPSVSDIRQMTPDARFEFRFSKSGRKAGHVLCDFAVQRRSDTHEQAATASFPGCYHVSAGPMPDGWQELQAMTEQLPPSIREIVKPSIDNWPRAAAENDGDPVFAVERFVTKLWDEGQVRIVEARLDLTPLEMAVNRVLHVFKLELYRPESLNEFSDWRSFVEVEGALGDSRRISRVYRPGLRRITGHECRLQARVVTEKQL